MLNEFKKFAMQGNMLDLAIGVVIGAAFGKIVDSLVNDLINPMIGMMGSTDLSSMFAVLKPGKGGETAFNTLKQAQDAGAVTFNYGSFVSAIINFLIVAFALFMVVKGVNKMRKTAEPEPAPGPGPEESLLTEIRDILKSK